MHDLEDLINEPLKIKTNGKEMLVEFDNNAIKFINKQTGLGRYEFYNKVITSGLTEEETEVLILAGLLRHQPKLTIKDIGEFTGYFEGILKTTIQGYMKIFIQPEVLKNIYFPDEGKEPEKKTENQTELTGQEN
jgi:hypothetical protein